MSNQKRIRNAQLIVSMLLDGVAFSAIQPRCEFPERLLEWTTFASGAQMVADRTAPKPVRDQIDLFLFWLDAEIARRAEVAYAEMLADNMRLAS